MIYDLDSWKSPAQFSEWLLSLQTDAPLGIAGGFNQHPIAFWLKSLHHPVTLWVRREVPGVVLYHDAACDQILIPSSHWVSRFCHALMIPDSYREVSRDECLATLARVVLLP